MPVAVDTASEMAALGAQVFNNKPHTHVSNIDDQIAKSVAFVSISVHLWRGQYHIKEAKVKVGDAQLSETVITKPRWQLVPPKWRERFSKLEARLKNCIDRARVLSPDADEDLKEAVRMPVRGLSIIPRSRLIQFFDELEFIENGEFKTAVTEFGADWDNVIQWIKSELTGQPQEVWKVVESHLPYSAAAAMGKFKIDKILIPIQLGGEANLAYLTGDAVTENVNRLRAYGRNFTAKMTDVILAGLQSELNDSVDNLMNRINDNGVIKDGTLSMVKNAFAKYRAFDFLMTDDLKKKMAAVAETLNEADCTDLNKDLKERGEGSMTAKLNEHLHAIRIQSDNEVSVLRAHGRSRRTIKV